jgi:Zn-dependent peptidase ImmA (M78 family)/DNA-binding XRE family transcriptional regulator
MSEGLNVNPEVLRWARTAAGVAVETVARSAEVTPQVVGDWEAGRAKPTLTQMRTVARLCQRTLATFYLEAPPAVEPTPTDYRIIPGQQTPVLVGDTVAALRHARSVQEYATQIAHELGKAATRGVPAMTLTGTPTKQAAELRSLLSLSVAEQVSWRDEQQAFKQWRRSAEALGAITLQLPVPLENARAFSLGGDVPIIAVSSRDSIRARIFSLWHEFAHIGLDKPGICLIGEGHPHRRGTGRSVEQFCDAFAAELLVPSGDPSVMECLRHSAVDPELPDEHLQAAANRYYVSSQVILRRLRTLDLITSEQYERKLRIWGGRRAPRPGGWGPPTAQRALNRHGVRYTSLLLEAEARGLATLSEVAQALSVHVQEVGQIAGLLEAAP